MRSVWSRDMGMGALRLLLLAVLTMPGCAAVEFGRQFDASRFDAAVQLGVTTQAQVRAWLGEPASTGIVVNEKGERATRWLYYFGKGKWPRLRQLEFRMLEVRFDERGLVQSYNWSAS